MPWGAALGAVGAIGGALISSDASSDAADAQAQGAANATAEQKREFDQLRSDNQPLLDTRNASLKHLDALLADPGSVTKDPSFAFGLNQGTQAIDRSAAGAGSLYSGATLKALQRYGTDYAGTKLGDVFNRYSTVAGLGNAATNSNTIAGTNAANQIGNIQTSLGAVNAANSLNQGNIWGNALGKLGTYAQKAPWGNLSANPYSSYGYENGSDIGWMP